VRLSCEYLDWLENRWGGNGTLERAVADAVQYVLRAACKGLLNQLEIMVAMGNIVGIERDRLLELVTYLVNPETPVDKLDELLNEIDNVSARAVDVGPLEQRHALRASIANARWSEEKILAVVALTTLIKNGRRVESDSLEACGSDAMDTLWSMRCQDGTVDSVRRAEDEWRRREAARIMEEEEALSNGQLVMSQHGWASKRRRR
jgi:hypothetical protein